MSNRAFVGAAVRWHDTRELDQQIFLDPQTSGGLLAACSGTDADAALDALRSNGVMAEAVGWVEAVGEGDVLLEFRP